MVLKLVPLELLALPRPSGETKPKFWFGERITFHSFCGTIYGVEWRSEEMCLGILGRHGWWYQCRWDKRNSLQKVHEDDIEKSEDLKDYV